MSCLCLASFRSFSKLLNLALYYKSLSISLIKASTDASIFTSLQPTTKCIVTISVLYLYMNTHTEEDSPAPYLLYLRRFERPKFVSESQRLDFGAPPPGQGRG